MSLSIFTHITLQLEIAWCDCLSIKVDNIALIVGSINKPARVGVYMNLIFDDLPSDT